MEQAFADVITALGRVDILFNHAGISLCTAAETMTFAEWRKVVTIDLDAVFLVARTAGRYMLAQKSGSIINTASMSGHIVNIPQKQCAYNSAKAGVIQLTKSLAVEWAPENIRVNCISPGYIETPMTAGSPEVWIKFWKSITPTQRMGRLEEIVGAVLYLASDAATFTTGCDLAIDGGFTCV